jgi:hypothetical protein
VSVAAFIAVQGAQHASPHATACRAVGLSQAWFYRLHRRPVTSPGSAGAAEGHRKSHARRLLVEAAWHHRKTYRTPGQVMRAPWEQAPAAARVRDHQGNQRLHQRWQSLTARRKRPVIANVAIAGELAGWA